MELGVTGFIYGHEYCLMLIAIPYISVALQSFNCKKQIEVWIVK